MNRMHRLNGSNWQRWDLHIHAPGTKLSDAFGEPSEENIKKYVEELQASDVQAFGITDYFSFDSYFTVLKSYKSNFPDGAKAFFLNIEFRLTETISSDGRNVHTHVLFDPDIATEAKLGTLLSDLHTHMTRNGARVRCNELKCDADHKQATVSIMELKSALTRVFPDDSAYLIITAANNDGLRGVDTKSARSLSISDELDKASHAFFGQSKNVKYFLKTDRYEDQSKALKKPVFCGSDAHSFEELSRLTGDDAGYEPTWIKADLTFRGLRQTLFEPEHRVHIGERPPVLERLDQDATRFITSLRIDQISSYSGANGSWFKKVIIPFNPELTAIVGNKGSGKSAVADIIGLLGESRQHEHFSFLTDDPRNRKFKQKGYAENFVGKLVWASGAEPEKRLDASVDELKPEVVKYLPQNYFESLTNEIEVKAFRHEIEEVVFSHVDESDRMGKSSFKELEDLKTAQSRGDISALKVRLRELNIEIVELEEQASTSAKARLKEQLKQRQEEQKALEKSKPADVAKPESETEEQRLLTAQIEAARNLLANIERRGRAGVERLTSLKTDHVDLGSIKESLGKIETHIKINKEELRATCARFGINIDAIISYEIDASAVDQRQKYIVAEIKNLEAESTSIISADTNFDELTSLSDLRNAHRFLSDGLKTLQETLSAPQRRYQRYVQTLSEITAKIAEVAGADENPKSGTIKDIERRIRYIENDLKAVLDTRYEDRAKIARSIFSSKLRVRSFYEGLKASVEGRLKAVSSDEFMVTIDASFVPLHDFADQFLALINQNARGPFKGNVDGRVALETLVADLDWNSIESILNFIDIAITAIKKQDIDKQIKDVKSFYDFLFSFTYFEAKYELRLGGKNLNQLSPGEKGLLLLVFYLQLDKENTPLIIDQPEDNLDNDSIFSVLARCIREAKKTRQVILVTHNPNLAIGADAEEIIHVTLNKASGYQFTWESGSIENPRINDIVVDILEGSRPAFVQRRLKYQIT